MKILVTGGYGNLGSWITTSLAKKGHQVFIAAKRQSITVPGTTFLHCDITNPDNCITLREYSFDVVIHLASANDFFVENYDQIAKEVNVDGTRTLLESLDRTRLPHFIYFSTFQVYGTYSGEITEKTLPKPTNTYGKTHLDAEHIIQEYHNTHTLPFTILRLTNSYGCPKDIESSKWYLVLNDLCKQAFETQTIRLKSNGKTVRDFIWMGDVCNVVNQLCLSPARNDIYNLSSENTYSMMHVAQAVQAAYKHLHNITLPICVNDDDLATSDRSLLVSSQKLANIISLNPKAHFIEEAIEILSFLNEHICNRT